MKYWLPMSSTKKAHQQDNEDEEPNEIDEEQAALSKFITKSSCLPNNEDSNNWGHSFKLHLVQKIPKWDHEASW